MDGNGTDMNGTNGTNATNATDPLVECCEDLNICATSNTNNIYCCYGICSPVCDALVDEPNPLVCCLTDEGCAAFNIDNTKCCSGDCLMPDECTTPWIMLLIYSIFNP